MPNDALKELSQARFDHAMECLQAAKSLLSAGNIKSAANRAYYAVFHAMRAVLAYDGIDMKPPFRHHQQLPQAVYQDGRV